MTKFFGLAAVLLMTVSLLTTVGCESSHSSHAHSGADHAQRDAAIFSNDGTLYQVRGGRNNAVFAYKTKPEAAYCEQCAADAEAYALTGELVETCSACGKKRYAADRVGPRPGQR